MQYKFLINGKVSSREQLSGLVLIESDLVELIETGSVQAESVLNEGATDAFIEIERVPDLSNNALRIALFAILSVLDEDSPDGLPDKYIPIFRKLGDELQYEELSYDDILNQLIAATKVKS